MQVALGIRPGWQSQSQRVVLARENHLVVARGYQEPPELAPVNANAQGKRVTKFARFLSTFFCQVHSCGQCLRLPFLLRLPTVYGLC